MQLNSVKIPSQNQKLIFSVKFFVKYHTELPEVLSCLVHFVVINYLRIYTVSEIENLKFGDFIHHEDKHGEYFLPSKRLQKIYASNNR